MRLTIITVVSMILSCAPAVLFNDGYDSVTVKKEHVYYARPVVISAVHNLDNSADDSGVYLNTSLFSIDKPIETKKSENYNETVDAFCRDMRYVAAEKKRDWSLIDKKYHLRINSLFLDTSLTRDTLPDSLQQALAAENINYLVVFHHFRSAFTQKSFVQSGSSTGSVPATFSVRGMSGTFSGSNNVTTHGITSTTGSLQSEVSTRVTMYYKGKRIYSFDYKGKSELSLEPICRGIFDGFKL